MKHVETRAGMATAYGSPCGGSGTSVTRRGGDQDNAVARAIVRAQSGDMGAIRFLYIRHRDNVYGYVLSIVGDRHEAEDVTQHVFLKLISVIGKYQPGEAPFVSWLLRVARNAAVDHLRQRRAIPCEEVHEPLKPADDAGRERRAGITEALGALSEEQRSVVILRHLVGLTPAEIAERMGRSEAAIHSLHHRARKAIRGRLIEADCAPTTQASA